MQTQRYMRMHNKMRIMETRRAYKFRIYPDSKRQETINESINLARGFYNKILERSIKERKISMQVLNRYANEIAEEDKSFKLLYSQTRQDIRIRVMKAYQNFFRRCKENAGKKGFPKFKSYDKYRSITYPQDNGSFQIECAKGFSRLRVARIGTMKIDMHRSIEGRIKTLTVAKEGNDYYAIFTAEQITNPPEIKNTNPVGMDMGLTNFIALSNSETIQKPKFFKQRERRIARWQRIVARRNKGSKRREKAKSRLQEEWKGITNQSNDFMHKLSDRLVHGGFTSFAVESLNIKNMVKNHRLAQSIQNASWNRFINMLSYKAESTGMKVIGVNPQYTSMTCSNCGDIKEIGEEREYICGRCGMRMDRDINASINILKRATLGQRESHARGEDRKYIPAGNANGLKEPRTYPANAGEAPNL